MTSLFARPATTQQLLDRLERHPPAPPPDLRVVRNQVRLRWAATLFTASLLPFSVFVGVTKHTWAWLMLAGVVGVLASVGLVALGIAWAASRKSAALADWGMKPLSEEGIDEFIELSDRHVAIKRVMSDTWFGAWIEQGHSLLGRDLVFLRATVAQYERLLASEREAAPPFHQPQSL